MSTTEVLQSLAEKFERWAQIAGETAESMEPPAGYQKTDLHEYHALMRQVRWHWGRQDGYAAAASVVREFLRAEPEAEPATISTTCTVCTWLDAKSADIADALSRSAERYGETAYSDREFDRNAEKGLIFSLSEDLRVIEELRAEHKNRHHPFDVIESSDSAAATPF